MNVCSLELARELHELSGWDDDGPFGLETWNGEIPKYDLGYLLRKLPPTTLLQKYEDTWQVWYFTEIYRAEIPEDAACKLACILIKDGIIKL